MAELAIAGRVDHRFTPTGRGTSASRRRTTSVGAPQVSLIEPLNTTLHAALLDGLVQGEDDPVFLAANLLICGEAFRPKIVQHFWILNESLSPSGPTLASAGRVMDERLRHNLLPWLTWGRPSGAVEWVVEASSRIARLAAMPDGWKGPGSVRASDDTVRDAYALLEKLQIEVPQSAPKISLDDDGEFIFFWRRPGLLASIQIGGDSAYSFFGNCGSGDVLLENIGMSEPMPRQVSGILNSRR